MKTEDKIKTYEYPDGSIQRVQTVKLEGFEELVFFSPKPSLKAYKAFCDIYQRFLIPVAPSVFGRMVMFHIGSGLTDEPNESDENGICTEPLGDRAKWNAFQNKIGEMYDTTCAERYGSVSDTLCRLTILLKENVSVKKDGVHFKKEQVKKLYEELAAHQMLQVESGNRHSTHMIPIGLKTGYLSETEKEAALKVNSSFFIMDRFDLASVYDCVGTPIGLMVKNGEILNPPLYKREALLVHRSGWVEIVVPTIETLGICIGEKTYRHAENGLVFTRPANKKTPVPTRENATDLVIIGKKIIAVHRVRSEKNKTEDKTENRTDIPASGFVLRVKDEGKEIDGADFKPGDKVTYTGLENVIFGLQVGNSILRNGTETTRFISPFYNIKRPWQTPFPPSLYPLDFERDRAARIALGANREGKPVLLWAEGAGKVVYEKGKDSRGATLAEMGRYCLDAGMVNAIGLDGGGSAQILLHNERKLKISDRRAEDNTELERAVPCGLIVR